MFTKWWTENLSSKRSEGQSAQPVLRRGRSSWGRMAAASILAVSLAVTSGCALLPKEEEEEVLPEITPPQISKKPEYEVTTTTLESRVQGTGKLMSMQEETLYFTLDGMRLKGLNVKAGDQVKAGQLIAELDVEEKQKQLRQKRLQFRKAEVTMKETLRKRDEMEAIEFEEAVILFEEQRQEIVDLEAEIAKSTLTAPFSGTVVQVNVEKGAQIKSYDPICIIANTSSLIVAASLSKDDLSKVTIGMPAVVEISGIGKVEGKVKQLPLPATNNGNGNGNGGQNGAPGGNGAQKPERPEDFLIVDVGKLPKEAVRGTNLTVSIVTKRKENAVVIPVSTLRTIGARTYVQVVEEDGSKREVDVAVGQQTSTQVEILEGLTPGQKVVGR
ncbi:efflux transporter periplasmic adaptor subunit [Paenibacillus sambharensis]|uniref:Efflux transporter periplasmic adaptor subunit n=1 Tax=Paenibacillus sambharensis TaxID=1803190 RepID=A0A2W1L6V8_9BACL|nr:biotin/lipoyl-binding protein [Paenibacillus sambharensis]PZD93860.1 efflux transporter periplasmic adaptor subunit [Paenibacillus sambharensis]